MGLNEALRGDGRTEADKDGDFLDDVVVRSALERLRREFNDDDTIESVHCARFDSIFEEKTDYIKVNCHFDFERNPHSLGSVVQNIADTGVVEIESINSERGYIRVAPSES